MDTRKIKVCLVSLREGVPKDEIKRWCAERWASVLAARQMEKDAGPSER